MAELKASKQGLIRIKQARNEKGWTVEDPQWLVEASKVLDAGKDWQDQGIYADGVSEGTWKAFLYNIRSKGIQSEVFKAYCEILNLQWQEVIESPNILEMPVATFPVNWHQVCRQMWNQQKEKQRIRRH